MSWRSESPAIEPPAKSDSICRATDVVSAFAMAVSLPSETSVTIHLLAGYCPDAGRLVRGCSPIRRVGIAHRGGPGWAVPIRTRVPGWCLVGDAHPTASSPRRILPECRGACPMSVLQNGQNDGISGRLTLPYR